MNTKPTIKIVNNRAALSNPNAHNELDLYILLTADSNSGLVATGLTVGTASKLSDFTAMEIQFDTIVSARLYIGYGPLASSPVPDGERYYGWIEFSKTATDTVVWINLSNVDMTGLPLTLQGTTDEGKSFSLGYKDAMTGTGGILKSLEATMVSGNTDAILACTSGQTKILAPNIKPDSYTSFEAYIEYLSKAEAKLSIHSDTPKSAPSQTFTGSFKNVFKASSKGTDVIISMTNSSGTVFSVEKQYFTSEIIYRCDGGKLSYGGVSYPQNRTPANDSGSTEDERTITNSTFRNILIGMNEGYFTDTGTNNSVNFPSLTPFANGYGNAYAQVLHETSNSYGFPYADSNLKVLITASPTETLTLGIQEDNVAADYDSDPPNSSKQPQFGDFQFGIGAGSSALGSITIGTWKYMADTGGAYGGFLPTLNEWTKMYFHGAGTDKYIWIKTDGTGQVEAGSCFNPAPTWVKGTLSWGGSMSWVAGASSPAKPT